MLDMDEDDKKNHVEKWKEEQRRLRHKVILKDTQLWQHKRLIYRTGMFNKNTNGALRYVAGFDISFDKNSTTRASAGLIILDITDNFRVVYQDVSIVKMKIPYISGFLGYREGPFLLKKIERLKRVCPKVYPQCIFVDGNGTLHMNKFGAACHIGVLTETPTIGVSKKLHEIFGHKNGPEHNKLIKEMLIKRGDHFAMLSNDEPAEIIAYCYKSTDTSTRPIYVSVGNMISWETCLWIMDKVIKDCRVPEPIRTADRLTREYLREHFNRN